MNLLRNNKGSTINDREESWLIENGRMYFVNRIVEGSADDLVIHIKTGAKKVVYTPTTKTGLKVSVQIIEGVTATDNGTAIICRNYNRNYADDGALTKAYHTPTYTDGTIIKYNQSGFGTNQGLATAGSSAEVEHYILKPNTSYVFLQTPSASTDQVYIADFYEV